MSMFPANAQGAAVVLFGLAGLVGASVTSYGAIGNGVANDTAAIQATINAVAAAGGGVAAVPNGTFLIDGIVLKQKVQLIGAGWSSVLKARHAGSGSTPSWTSVDLTNGNATYPDVPSGTPCYSLVSVDQNGSRKAGIAIRNLFINGDGGTFGAMTSTINANASYALINAANSTGIEIENVNASQCAPDVNNAGGYRAWCLLLNKCDQAKVVGGLYEVAGYDCIGLRGVDCTNSSFLNVKATDAFRGSLQSAYGVDGLFAFGCTFDNGGSTSSSHAFYFHGTRNVVAVNCYFGSTNGCGFAAFGDAGANATDNTHDSASSGALASFQRVTNTPASASITVSTASPSVATLTSHGLTDGSPVSSMTIASTPAISAAQRYFAKYISANTFSLYYDKTLATPLNVTSGATGTIYGTATNDDRYSELITLVGCKFRSVGNACFLLTSRYVRDVSVIGGSIEKFITDTGGQCISATTDSYTNPIRSLTFQGVQVRQGSTAVIASIGGVSSVTFRDCVLEHTYGNHGIEFTRCNGVNVDGNTFYGTGNSYAIRLLTNGGVQCSNVNVNANRFTGLGWQRSVCVDTTAIDALTYTNNDHGALITQPWQSDVTGNTTLLCGKAAPTNLVVRANRGTNWASENRGSGQIDSGRNNVAVTHSIGAGATALPRTLTVNDVIITPTAPLRTAVSYAVSAISTTTFTVTAYDAAGAAVNVGANFTFTWKIDVS